MKKGLLVKLAVLLASMMVFYCDNGTDPDDAKMGDTTGQTIEPVVGLWLGAMPDVTTNPPGQMSLSMEIMDANTEYNLYVESGAGDSLFYHQGQWSLNAAKDTINFAGSNCRRDSAKIIIPFDCGDAIPVHVDIIDSTWNVAFKDLEPVAFAIIGDSAIVKTAGFFMPVVEMERQN
ncbi:MAG: hypothetical protein GF398_05430 [Chitinivibrionales bacterium]|nr:hypothetical protein [Chitinivibrionales bacterium]